MSIIVCKFGGTSLAQAQSFERVRDIILSDNSRKYIVVSAIGKTYLNDTKVTDLLYKCDQELKSTWSCPSFKRVANKFISICKTLEIDLDIESLLDDVYKKIVLCNSTDYTASRGEFLTATVFSKYIGFPFVDSGDFVVFNDDNTFNSEDTNKLATKLLNKYDYCVISGFYGCKRNGDVVTFSRGGSDITGAIVAKAVNADLYENWTDANGFRVCDPKYVSNAIQMYSLSYSQLRHLSYMGSSILHAESIFPVLECAIPINIRNTFNTSNDGTMILPTAVSNRIVNGIAAKSGFCLLKIQKEQINNQNLTQIINCFNDLAIKIENITYLVDSVTIIVDKKQISRAKTKLFKQLSDTVAQELIDIENNISLISVLTNKNNSLEVVSPISNKLLENKINIHLIEIINNSVLISVDSSDCQKSVQIIYSLFF